MRDSVNRTDHIQTLRNVAQITAARFWPSCQDAAVTEQDMESSVMLALLEAESENARPLPEPLAWTVAKRQALKELRRASYRASVTLQAWVPSEEPGPEDVAELRDLAAKARELATDGQWAAVVKRFAGLALSSSEQTQLGRLQRQLVAILA